MTYPISAAAVVERLKPPGEGRASIMRPRQNASRPGEAEPSNGALLFDSWIPGEPINFLYCLSLFEVVLFHLEH